MTQPDFRAELQLLVKASNQVGEDLSVWWDAVDRAEAALATPPPEPPTDEELDALWIEQYGYTGRSPAMSIFDFKPAARAVLKRWGK